MHGPLRSIAKDEFNLPKYRYFNLHIHMANKMDGQCRVGTVTLRESYEGGGNQYKSPQIFGAILLYTWAIPSSSQH